MFRSIRKFVWPHRERLLALVMLPAFFLASLPHTACICADGHREPFCQASACHARNSGSSATACCGCSCCQVRGAAQPRSCCLQKSSEPTGNKAAPAHGLRAKTGPCCQPFVAAPAPAIKSSKAEQPSREAFVATAELLHLPLYIPMGCPAIELLHSSAPPPLDAVIVFQRLTI